VEWIDDFSKVGRENQKMMFKYGLIFLRECLAIKATGSTQKISGDELKLATAMAGRLSAEQIENIVLLITNAHYHIERNAHPKILLMSNTLKIAQAIMGEYVPTEPEA
jgi:DNA polymerase-3 subunit delta'